MAREFEDSVHDIARGDLVRVKFELSAHHGKIYKVSQVMGNRIYMEEPFSCHVDWLELVFKTQW